VPTIVADDIGTSALSASPERLAQPSALDGRHTEVMRSLVVVVAAAGVLAFSGCAGSAPASRGAAAFARSVVREATPTASSAPKRARATRELIGVESPFSGGQTRLAQLDPTTLRPLSGHSSTLPDYPTQYIVSPDGNTLALGGENGEVYLADLARLGRSNVVRRAFPGHQPGYPSAFPISWPAPSRLVVIEQPEAAHVSTPATLIWVDPQTRRVTRLRHLHRSVIAAATTTAGIAVLLLGPRDLASIGPTELVEVTRGGHLRTRSLPTVRAGFVDPGNVGSAAVSPGLTVGGGRLYVSSRSVIVSGTLSDLHLSAHHVPNLLAAHYLAFTSTNDGSAGALAHHDRTVSILSKHRLLVAGDDTVAIDRGRRLRTVVAKTTIVDTRRWRVSHVLPRLTSPVAEHPEIIGSFTDRRGRQIGVTGYRADGQLAFSTRLTETQNFWWTDHQLTTYSMIGPPRAVLLNPTTGHVVRSVHPLAGAYPFPLITWTPGHRHTAAPSNATSEYTL